MKRIFIFLAGLFLISGLSSVNGAEPVYVISDNINNVDMDNNRIDYLVAELNKKGTEAYNCGVGTNNIDILYNIPNNSTLIQIVGGSDAGMIWEMGTPWYKMQKGDRTVILVFVPPAVNIDEVSYLERAHDDNFSPGDFCGLENPSEYLRDNGYQYHYWLDNTPELLNKIEAII